MRILMVLAAVISVVWGQQADAGAWPRDPGGVFLSLSVETDRNDNRSHGLYAEYGLSKRRVLGLEINHTNVGETSVLVWLQRSLDRGGGPHRFSYAIGLGAVRREGEVAPLGQLALAWGHGFQDLLQGGWLAAEGRLTVAGDMETVRVRQGMTEIEYAYLTPRTSAKLNLTLGLNISNSMKMINQLRLEKPQEGELTARYAASLVRDLSGPVQLELGLVAPIAGPGEPALRLGTWISF